MVKNQCLFAETPRCIHKTPAESISKETVIPASDNSKFK